MPKVSRNIAWAVLGNIMSPLAGFISAPILAYGLGAAGRGEVAAATAPLLLCASALTLGLPEATTFVTAGSMRSSSQKHFLRSSIMIIMLGLFGVIALYTLAPVISSGQENLTSLIRLVSLALPPALLLALIRGLAAGRGSWRLITLERTLNSFFRLVAFIILVANDALDPISAAIVIGVSSFIGMFAYVGLLFDRKKAKARDSTTEQPISVINYGLRVWFGSLTGIMLTRLDQVLLVPLSNTIELGLYAIAVSVAEMVLIFNAAVRDVMFSTESKEASSSRLAQATRISTLLTGILAVIIGALSIPVTPWLFGEEFKGAVPIILVLLVGIYVGNPGSIAGAGLSARGRPELRSFSLAIALVANVIVLILLVPHYGALGAAWATLVGNAVAGYLNIVWLRVHFKIPVKDFLGFRKVDLLYLRETVVLRIIGRRRNRGNIRSKTASVDSGSGNSY